MRAWSDAVEGRPIMVTQVENVPLDEMRGFSLSDGRFPIIALNSKEPFAVACSPSRMNLPTFSSGRADCATSTSAARRPGATRSG